MRVVAVLVWSVAMIHLGAVLYGWGELTGPTKRGAVLVSVVLIAVSWYVYRFSRI